MSRPQLDPTALAKSTATKQIIEQLIVDNCPDNNYTFILIDNITRHEANIDSSKKLYGVTWCPDPKLLPDSNFELQHDFNVQLLSDFLKNCSCGLFCVEATQNGNPHYHGWYQCSEIAEAERGRLAIVKTLKAFGRWEPNELKKYKIGKFTSKGNGLWYYKKEYLFAQRDTYNNPIHSKSVPLFDWSPNTLFWHANVKERSKIYDVMANRKYNIEFYTKIRI